MKQTKKFRNILEMNWVDFNNAIMKITKSEDIRKLIDTERRRVNGARHNYTDRLLKRLGYLVSKEAKDAAMGD